MYPHKELQNYKKLLELIGPQIAILLSLLRELLYRECLLKTNLRIILNTKVHSKFLNHIFLAKLMD